MNRLKFLSTLMFISITSFASQSYASQVVIDFEGLQSMTFIAGSQIPDSAQLSTQYLSSHGVSFSSGADYVAVVALGIGHATSGVNGIGGASSLNTLTYESTTPIVAKFFDPNNNSVAAVTDFVSLRVDMIGNSSNVTLNAYGINGDLITSFTTLNSNGATLSVSAPGIHSVSFIGTTDNDGAAIDDFTFNAVSAVPEPTNVVLWVAGIFAIGASAMRKRQLSNYRPHPSLS